MRKRILFVDDELNVLEGIRRMLRPMRLKWDMAFASGGEEALSKMAALPFDVVVSDIRMPGMGGAELLQRVRDRHPGAVRVALSGHFDRQQAVRLAGTVHQYLSKPCGHDRLMSVLARACQMSNLLANEKLRHMVSQIDALPSLPALHVRLIEELRKAEPQLDLVEEIVSQDMGMSSKVLQLVNSSFFGLRRSVASPSQAVGLLGLDTMRALAHSLHIFSQFDGGSHAAFSSEHLWEHCMATGVVARRIALAEEGEGGLVDDAYVAGLLHDVGILAIASNLPEEFSEILDIVCSEGIEISEAEKRVLGATHGEVGAYLLALWGLSESVVEALLFHHNPADSHGSAFSALTAVHVGNYFAHGLHDPENAQVATSIQLSYLERIGAAGRVDDWLRICEETSSKEEADAAESVVR